MLNKIQIQNFALIDSLEIQLEKGLQVITGETGAGKSIILGALRLILGERADAKSIQNSDKKSIVETEFSIPENLKPFFEENDLDYENPTIIRREILPNGKSRAFVNDVPVTLEVLKNLSENLIDIHSQFETSNLFSQNYQFKILDGISENKTLIADFQTQFQEYQKLQKTLENLRNQLSEGNKEADYQLFLLNELEEANLDEVHWEDLQQQLSTLENMEAISENLSEIFSRTDAEQVGLLDTFSEIRNKLGKVGTLSHQFTELDQRLESNFLEFKDILFELQNKAERLESNPKFLDETQSKINAINRLLQKHQANSVEELIEIKDRISGEQLGFSELEKYIGETEKNLERTVKQLNQEANLLSKNRKKAIPNLEKQTETLLQKLGLEKAKLEVKLTDKKEFNQFGKEEIEILFQANSGFPLKPIQTAISGGERSRVMLAFKKIMAENTELPTLILDEIDTGVSGKVAEEIGNVMKQMSKDMQLIVITHLAQVAAKGDRNYKVVKQDFSGKTQSNIISLDTNEKLQEIAQLLSGSKITEAALQQAKELMN